MSAVCSVNVGGPGGPAQVVFGAGSPVLIAGPCGLESREVVLRTASGIAAVCDSLGMAWVFKGSFDKANRTSAAGWRGPGIDEGLRLLEEVRREVGVPVTTDVHHPEQASLAGQVVDLLQVPAFLCRQTDLLLACNETQIPVNVKKGQFLAPQSAKGIVDKAGGPGRVLLTERGTSFGYGDLVVDFRSLVWMRELGVPVVFDATHSVQRPGAEKTGGLRDMVPPLARAAVAVGVDALFMEVHPCPEQALSDADSQIPLHALENVLAPLVALWRFLS